ncbi:hypothetical protein BGZ65_006132, partial [Modicella reniformis]
MELPESAGRGGLQSEHSSIHTSIDISSERIAPQSYSPLQFRSTSERSSSAKSLVRYCCCCPVASGIWIIPLFLIIPSVVLVLGFNIANIQRLIRFHAPVHVRIVYTAIYSVYALLGLGAGVGLRRLTIKRRLTALIMLYWILITATIVEGVYFGVVMSKQKNKLVSYCDDGGNPGSGGTTIPASASTNSTIIPVSGTGNPTTVICRKTHMLIGAFYILGPGGWIILHSAWILIIILYSKALRRQYPANNELLAVKRPTSPFNKGNSQWPMSASVGSWRRQATDPKDKITHDMELMTGTHPYQQHPFHHATPSSESRHGLGAMF